MNSLIEVMEFDKLKVVKTYTRKAQDDTHRQKCPQSRHVNTVAAIIPQDNAQHMKKDA